MIPSPNKPSTKHKNELRNTDSKLIKIDIKTLSKVLFFCEMKHLEIACVLQSYNWDVKEFTTFISYIMKYSNPFQT